MAEDTKPWKIRENRLRATAKRQGLVLHRSPRRDTRALDYGKYWLFRDNIGVTAVAGVTLDEIEQHLTGEHPDA